MEILKPNRPWSGNLGRAHEFDTLLQAADRLCNRPEIVFLFIGGGGRIEDLKRRVMQKGLDARFQFRPYQDRDRLSLSLSLPDIHWISLRPQLEGLIVPSKLYGALAAGRPTIAVTALDGEVATIIKRAGCGIVVQPGSAEALASSISELADAPDRCREMGARARMAAQETYSRAHALTQWEELLTRIPQMDGLPADLSALFIK